MGLDWRCGGGDGGVLQLGDGGSLEAIVGLEIPDGGDALEPVLKWVWGV
jgi:hypothetical protein